MFFGIQRSNESLHVKRKLSLFLVYRDQVSHYTPKENSLFVLVSRDQVSHYNSAVCLMIVLICRNRVNRYSSALFLSKIFHNSVDNWWKDMMFARNKMQNWEDGILFKHFSKPRCKYHLQIDRHQSNIYNIIDNYQFFLLQYNANIMAFHLT